MNTHDMKAELERGLKMYKHYEKALEIMQQLAQAEQFKNECEARTAALAKDITAAKADLEIVNKENSTARALAREASLKEEALMKADKEACKATIAKMLAEGENKASAILLAAQKQLDADKEAAAKELADLQAAKDKAALDIQTANAQHAQALASLAKTTKEVESLEAKLNNQKATLEGLLKGMK